MAPLDPDLRSALEKAIVAARDDAEKAAEVALKTLAVDQPDAFSTQTAEQRRLRKALRARARQLGGGSQQGGFHPLVEEVAYEQWHRMLFARFLAENGLLMHPSGVAVTLQDCAELAAEEGEADVWALAARYAGRTLPGIFREDDPSAQVPLAREGRVALETILAGPPPTAFTADDALGWVYQFWQTKKRKELSQSGRKISGVDIGPATQIFTDDYQVRFLLENSLGAWWAARHPDSPLLKKFTYLRFKDDGTPAAGTFPGWPEPAAAVTVMDPCCGSGHFLVAAFEMLRRMRMEEEGLGEAEAADAVLRDNLFGMEIDPRCVQIAAFAAALAAWKAGGYRLLPSLKIACSGIPVTDQLEQWRKLAGDDVNLKYTLERLYHLFRNAPDLGSLIDPANVPVRDRMFAPEFAKLAPLLERVLTKDQTGDPVAAVFGESALGVARAAEMLSRQYTLVATNVPYLTRFKQGEILKAYCESQHPAAKADLATAFLERCNVFVSEGGSYALVTPQNWLFLGAYERLRVRLLKNQQFDHVSRIGSGATATASWEVARALIIITNSSPVVSSTVTGIDASQPSTHDERARIIRAGQVISAPQREMLLNPDARIAFSVNASAARLETYATSIQGLKTGDDDHYRRRFWEIPSLDSRWCLYQSTFENTAPYDGRTFIVDWREDGKLMARRQGVAAWEKLGVAVSQMRTLPASLYTGEKFDSNVSVVVPLNPAHLPAIWAYCQSVEFNKAVRQLDQSLAVTNATLVKVPFDLPHWRDRLSRLADEDGIVPLSPAAGEEPAAERLRTVLAAAYGEGWSVEVQERLLQQAGFGGKGLDVWLRDGFFEQHCKLFQQRPFIWHIWDGRRDGFSALVNYHTLDAAHLGKLIYTYLGDWIRTQRAARDAGTAGADVRLVAALDLQKKLEAIRDGEPPYDLYVRWKPIEKQPIGWNPDLDDGVRLNIRPFVTAGVLRARVNVNWNKDRGTNPDGSERINDRHLTIAEKQAARRAAGLA